MSGDWLEGLAAMGCSVLKLQRNGKRPIRGFDHALQGRRGAEAARRWLKRGWNVGILPGPGLWVLDIDEPGQIERIVSEVFERGSQPLAVSTPSGGMHLYGMLPDDFPLAGLKNHLHQDGLGDFKLGPRTMIVCPGSRRDGIEYRPARAFMGPPVLDPRWFREGGFWHVRDDRPFLTNPRPLGDRLVAARKYLETIARVSVSGKGGHLALARVCSHLVAYHRIEPRTALTMLAGWNSRCRDLAGKPSPWSRSELMSALEAARYSVPEAGVKAYQRAEAAHDDRQRIVAHVATVKAALTMTEASRVPAWRVRRLLRWFGLDLTETAFGDALRNAGVGQVNFTRKRIQGIPRLSYRELVAGLLAGKRGTEGGALNKQEPSLRVRNWTVEKVVSEKNTLQTRAVPGLFTENGQNRGVA